jgi:CRISPR-associated protein (TIGR03986 family)
MSAKPYRIRVRVLDGKPRNQKDLNQLKSNILRMAHLDIVDAKGGIELIVCASQEKHLADVRAKLHSAGLEEIEGGDTATARASTTSAPQGARQGGSQQRAQAQSGQQPSSEPQHQQRGQTQSGRQQPSSAHRPPEVVLPDLRKKPYGFVALPKIFTTAEPVWHDGTSSAGRLSGEIRFELETLTPLLVGWERGIIGSEEADWPVPANLDGIGQLENNKSVLCPLRAPWGERPVIIPGDTLKGLLRHELGALLGAPLERVAERSYSYRPNAMFPSKSEGRFLVPRLARVPQNGVETKALGGNHQARVPMRLELFPAELEYNKKANRLDYHFDAPNGAPYRGGQGAGERLNSKRNLHTTLTANPNETVEVVDVPETVQQGYLATIRHLIDEASGHFSERHPDAKEHGAPARMRILEAAKNMVFQPGDMLWVEWDTEKRCIVSFGWHYYYRWAYIDTVRKVGGKLERHGLFPLDKERELDADGDPKKLSPVRRLFGYTGDNDGNAGIGQGDYTQLMGRIAINAGLEVIEPGDTEEQRFLRPTFLKELGMPRPSAVEFYLKQPHHPGTRPTDNAQLVTYGDAVGYDEPGDLAGRKFYLDRGDAYSSEPWKDDSVANRTNERSTLALEASHPHRRFRFTLRFSDLDPADLAAVLVALCPHQFREVLGGTHTDGYCSKLGYARPLGWGSVRIEAKALLLLDIVDSKPVLRNAGNVITWTKSHYTSSPMQEEWLAIHRHKHPDAQDYQRHKDRDGNENIYTFHTNLRAKHSHARRYRKGGRR